ncbi:MAG: hypothetical protein AAFX06_09095 [Planctomycetota bacterium]
MKYAIELGREDIALYTGNDDNIICDLLTARTTSQVRQRLKGAILIATTFSISQN